MADVLIRIKGTDDASAVFRKIGESGKSMSRDIDDGAKKSARSLDDMNKASKDVALGAAALATAFTLASRSLLTQEQSIKGIQKAYGDSSADILKFADALQQTTVFSNDAARSAALAASTITREYGLSAEQAQILIQRAADLTAIYGGTLVDNTNRLASATRGEAEAAEFLGIAMADSVLQSEAAARGFTGWTTTMTEAEKAAIRFDVMLEQTAFSQGAAAEAADTTAGKVKQLQNELQDATVGFVEMTGPVAEVAGALGEQSIQAGLAVGGLVKLGAGLKTLAATAGLTSAALGPVGLVIAAVAAGVAIYQLTKGNDDAAEATKALDAASQDLTTTLNNLAAAGDPNAATGAAWLAALNTGLDAVPAKIAAIQTELDKFGAGSGEPTAIDPNATDEATLRYVALTAQLDALAGASAHVTEAQVALGAILHDTGTGAELAQARAAELFDEFGRTGDVAVLIDGLIWINTHLTQYDINANAATKAAKDFALAQFGAADGVDVLAKANAALTVGFSDTAKGQEILNDLTTIGASQNQILIDSALALWARLQANTIGVAEYAAGIDKLADNAEAAAIAQAKVTDSSLIQANANDLNTFALQRLDAAQRKTIDSSLIQANANDENAFALQRLAAEQRVSVDYSLIQANANDENTFALQRLAMAERDANEARKNTIIDLPELGKILDEQKQKVLDEEAAYDKLKNTIIEIPGLEQALIEAAKDHRTALERVAAGSTSAAIGLQAFKDVQDGLIASQGEFTGQLSEYNTQLGYLEAAENLLNERKAEGIALSAEQEDFLNRVDDAQARLQGGTEDATLALGNQALMYAENMKKGDEMNRALSGSTGATEALTASVNALILTLGGIPPETNANVTVTGLEAAGALMNISNILDEIDGKTANTYINIYEQRFGAGSTDNTSGGANSMHGGTVAYAHGGTVSAQDRYPHAAHGVTSAGQMTWVGEVGPELLNLPIGAQVTPHGASMARAKGGGGGGNIYIQNLQIYPATPDVESAIRARVMAGR